MSTDDSASEEVSSSVALSLCNASPDGGRDNESSALSSEGTSASCQSASASASEGRQTASQTTGGTVQCRVLDHTGPHSKIRELCLTPDVFEPVKNLPFINPSSIETLRALVQAIRNSGETNPELWKDCEGRWLNLFQLVEKQYQEQILAQQEQYQCHVQLIQDEIKALVQIQNRQAKGVPGVPSVPSVEEEKFAPAQQTVAEIGTGTMLSAGLSSGYGTVSAWGTESFQSSQEGALTDAQNKALFLHTAEREADLSRNQHKPSREEREGQQRNQQRNQQPQSSGTKQQNQQLTSWLQRNKLRSKKNHTHQPTQLKSTDSPDQPEAASVNSFFLRRSDSLLSEASGLTYWRLHESELFRPLPDSFDSGAPLLKEESLSSIPSQLSLKEIYCNKRVDRNKPSSSPQSHGFVLDSVTRQSDHTSGFTSPSHFSSPSLSTPSHLLPEPPPFTPEPPPFTPEAPFTPDSMVLDSGHHPDCVSETSSVSAARLSTLKLPERWAEFPSPVRNDRSPHGAPGERDHRNTGSEEDPVILSLLRQNLRQKHSRHVADLRAYYEAEIQNLLDKLRLKDLPNDLEKSNQALSERCKLLEKSLAEARRKIQQLEENNLSLEEKLSERSDRFSAAAATVKSLQKHLEESRHSNKDKDASIARLKSDVRQLEEDKLKTQREAEDKEARREREYNMLQDLLGQYDSLMKKHEGLKINLVSTENKLVDAQDEISELKRTISKMESQVKQLEHENQARLRFPSHKTQPSGAGLFHHPDLLLSPTKGNAAPDVTQTSAHSPGETIHNDTALSQSNQSLSQLNQSLSNTNQSMKAKFNKSPTGGQCPGGAVDTGLWKAADWDLCQTEGSRKQTSSVLTPMMRAIIELEETRATQGRAPWTDHSKSTLGFVEHRLKIPIQDRAGKSRVRALQGTSSPDSHRSASLPPPAQRSAPPPATPSKRETLLMPVSAKSSPKRCPSENFSTAFGHSLPREEHLQNSPRKRLLFSAAEEPGPDPAEVQVQDWGDRQRERERESVPRAGESAVSVRGGEAF